MLSGQFQVKKGVGRPYTPNRSIFNRFFGSAKCQQAEPIFRKFQTKCEEQITHLESTFKEGSLNHLLQSLYKCQQISIRDKFFYDSLLQQIQGKLPKLIRAKDMVLLGAALGTNKDFSKDHPELIKDFYAHVFKHRFLLSLEDKKALNTIFQEVSAVQLFRKHLDLFQEIPRKEVASKTCELLEIQLPADDFRIDFDHQNRVVILQNKKSSQSIILYGSLHDQPQSIAFGKQLIDTFKPTAILVEDGPLQSLKKEKTLKDGIWEPAEFDLVSKLSGAELSDFIKSAIVENKNVYEVDSKLGLVLKKYADGLEPSDFATYAHYFHSFKQKTNSVDEHSQLIFGDLSNEQISTSFLLSTNQKKRLQLIEEIRYGALFETTSWLAQNYKQGCVKCAPFLTRQMLQAYPVRPIQLLSSEQIPSFAMREKNIAHRILEQALQQPGQNNFVAFVGREHLLNVAKDLTNFINNPKSYMEHCAPPQLIENSEVRSNPEHRQELAKTLALASTLYGEELADSSDLPFPHTETDLDTYNTSKRDIQGKLALVDLFEDMKALGLELKSGDFVPESKIQTHLDQHEIEDKELLLNYIKSEKGGGGIAKCFPVSFIQGNLAHFHLNK